MLTGEAKTDYQREYMRKRRAVTPVRPQPLDPPKSVRPKTNLVRPAGLSDNQWAYIQFKAGS